MTEQRTYTPEQTVGAALESQARRLPNKDALVFGGRRATFSEWNDSANKMLLYFESLGFRKGDCVGVMLPSCVELPFVILGLAKMGAIGVLINPMLPPGDVEFQLRDTDAKALVALSPFVNRDLVAMVEGLRPSLPSLGPIIVMGPPREGYTPLHAILAGPTPPPAETYVREGVTYDDPFVLLFSGGTTGTSKAVPATSYNSFYVDSVSVSGSGDNENDVNLVVPPLFLSFGFTMLALTLLTGAKAVGLQGFDPRAILQTIQDEKVTIMTMYPPMLRWVMSLPTFDQYDVSSMRRVATGGDVVTMDLVNRIREKFRCPCLVGYGMTEMRGITVTGLNDPPEYNVTTDGKPIRGLELKIVDDDGKQVPFGEVGEMCIRHRAVFAGYWKRPELNTQVFDADGFFHTGDLGRFVNQAGYIRFVGRKKDTIRRSFTQVYPEEIENLLRSHPKIAGVGVIGVPSPVVGERIRAYVQLRPTMEMTPTEVVEFCRATLAANKIPDEVRFVEALPLSATQRVRRWLLREEARKEMEQGG